MTKEIRKPSDIVDLFLKFGGNPLAYREFKPMVEAKCSVSQSLHATPGVKAVPIGPVPIGPVPMELVQIGSVPIQLTQPARPRVAGAVESLLSTGEIPRELDAIFLRLTGKPAAPAEPAHGLLSQWRRQA